MFIVAAVFLTTCQAVLSEMSCPQSLPTRQRTFFSSVCSLEGGLWSGFKVVFKVP